VMGSQIESNRQILAESQVGVAPVSEDGGAMSITQLKAQLADLKSSYTDRHPDVIKLKAKIADLEAQYTAGEPASSGETRSSVSGDPALQLVSNTLNELMRQRGEVNADIKNIALEISELKQQLREYQQRRFIKKLTPLYLMF